MENAVEKYLENYESGEEESESISSEEEPEKKWDCESILTTYSNIYNHPRLISEPKTSKIKSEFNVICNENVKLIVFVATCYFSVCPKTGVPLDVLGKPGLTKKYLDLLNQENGKKEDCAETQSIISTLSTISIRPKDETPEQRKERKNLIKEYRRVIVFKMYL